MFFRKTEKIQKANSNYIQTRIKDRLKAKLKQLSLLAVL